MGTAAGGGFPQWNCRCRGCQIARTDPRAAWPRTQSSVAISSDGSHWFLLNASPDVREQLGRLPPAGTDDDSACPIEASLTMRVDHPWHRAAARGEILAALRDAAIRSVLDAIRESCRLRCVADMPCTEMPLDAPVELVFARVKAAICRTFSVPRDPPRFASVAPAGHTVGLEVREPSTGRVCMFLPGCGGLSSALLDRLAQADVLLFDGTFWNDDEPIRLSISTRTAREMDHLPISGPGGSLESLATLPCSIGCIRTSTTRTRS